MVKDCAKRVRLWALQDFTARDGARRERVGEPRNDRMGEPFFGHAASDVGNMISELSCEFIHALDHGVGIDVQLFRQPVPVI